MDRNCTKCKYLWVPDESDVKKDGTYCKSCEKCRDKASKYFEKKPDLFNKDVLCGCGWTYYKRHYKRHLDTEHHKRVGRPSIKVHLKIL
jgi:hypothetical protein